MDQKRLIILSIIGTGITSVTTQLVTIREFLTQFHGNEITISLSLFCWLLLTGIGSLAAKAVKHSSLRVYALLILIIAVWPLLQLIAIRGLRDTFFTHGVSPGFYSIFFYILVIVTPYCFLVGFILPYAQKVLNAESYSFKSGDLYLTDSIGDITGGILFSFVLVYWLKPFAIIAVSSTLLILTAVFLLFKSRAYALLFITLALAFIFYGYATNSRFERHTLAAQYGNIVQYSESPYGRIVISREGSQHTFWESGTPLYSGSNIITSEEKVHYALCQLDRIENVLLVSGGLGETIKEVGKYHPAHVDYVELDPALTEAALDLGVIEKASFLEIMNTDGRSYIKTAKRKYDAVIIDLPDPDTFQINRFFTSEFFACTKKILKKGGVLSLSIEYSPNYISDSWRKKFATIHSTVSLHFQNVLVLPGEEAYFLCRDGELRPDIPVRLNQKSIRTSYIEGFFYGNVTEERIRNLKDIVGDMPVNTDFNPTLITIVFHQWFVKHGTSPNYFLFAMLGLTVIYMVFMRKEEYILFSTGLAGMGVEMLVIFVFQVIYGYIYLKIGAIVTAFLLGLLPGAMVGKLWGQKTRIRLAVSELLILSLLFLFYLWAAFFRSELHQIYFLAYCFVFSFLCGFQFPVVAGIIGENQSPAAGCLAADLAGAAVGTLATGTILIPLWGIQATVIFLIIVKISSGVVIFSLSSTRG
ncbi:MAG: fused MFS/spermidine synthase [Deltaproteobacteria bacterium]|nr:fused MFS/spermidine synthase [Deltaproteobacteria bacterium]